MRRGSIRLRCIEPEPHRHPDRFEPSDIHVRVGFPLPALRFQPPQLNGALFEVTLTSSLLAIFLFGVAGVYYLEVVGVAKNSVARKKVLIERGDALFVLSLLIGTAMPALILFTLGIIRVAIIAAILRALCAGFITQQGRKLRTR